MHEVEPHVGICRELVVCVTEQRLQIKTTIVFACSHIQFPHTDLASHRRTCIPLLALPQRLLGLFALYRDARDLSRPFNESKIGIGRLLRFAVIHRKRAQDCSVG